MFFFSSCQDSGSSSSAVPMLDFLDLLVVGEWGGVVERFGSGLGFGNLR